MIKVEMESEILRKRAVRAKPTTNLEAMLEAQMTRLVLCQMEKRVRMRLVKLSSLS